MANAIIVEPYDLVTVTADGSVDGTLPGNLNNDWMGVIHRGLNLTASPPQFIAADLGVAREVDALALLSSNGSMFSYDVRGGTSVGDFSLYHATAQLFTSVGAITPTSGRLNTLHLLTSPVTARVWTIEGETSIGARFEAGRMVVGKRYQPSRNFSFGAAFGAIDRGGGEFNAQGVWLPKPGAVQRTVGLSFSATTRQEAETILLPLLERVGNRKHILLVTNPDVDALRQRRMYFGPLQGNLETLWRVADGWEWRANLVSTI